MRSGLVQVTIGVSLEPYTRGAKEPTPVTLFAAESSSLVIWKPLLPAPPPTKLPLRDQYIQAFGQHYDYDVSYVEALMDASSRR
jgi:hypothetical protein